MKSRQIVTGHYFINHGITGLHIRLRYCPQVYACAYTMAPLWGFDVRCIHPSIVDHRFAPVPVLCRPFGAKLIPMACYNTEGIGVPLCLK